jgi:hypothetical protein
VTTRWVRTTAPTVICQSWTLWKGIHYCDKMAPFLFVVPFYLQSVPVHSANCV